MHRASGERRIKVTVILWLVVLLEIISPVPALLSFGAIYVLLFKPTWFRTVVSELYAAY